MFRFYRFALVVLLCTSLAPRANAVDYARNRCEDGSVWIAFAIGSVLFVGTFIPAIRFWVPQGDYNMQPDCPSSNPTTCCTQANPPTACVPPSGLNCAAPKVAYCTGNAVPASMTYQSWVTSAAIPLSVLAAAGFITALGGTIAGCCCYGTCGLGFT